MNKRGSRASLGMFIPAQPKRPECSLVPEPGNSCYRVSSKTHMCNFGLVDHSLEGSSANIPPLCFPDVHAGSGLKEWIHVS